MAADINTARAQHSVVIKGTVHLISHNKISGKITNTNDSGLIVFTGGDTTYKYISATDIRFIRIKRRGLQKGLAYGAVIGGIVGYVVGNATYNDNSSYDDDSSKQQLRSWAGAIVGVAPGAFVGGIIGGIFTKRRFKIEGDKEKL